MRIKFIFLGLLVLLVPFFSFWNWYGPHSVSYSDNGSTRCDGDWDCSYDSNWNIISCTNNDYPDIDFDPITNWEQYRDYAVDVNWDGKIDSNDYVSNWTSKSKSVSSNGSMNCFYWDWQAPTVSNLTIKVNWKNVGSNLLTTDNADIEFIYNDTDGWWSSSVTIYYQLEDYNSDNQFLSEQWVTLNTNSSTASVNGVNWNISHVLPWEDFSGSIWWRQYSIKITKICDSAWNCSTPSKNYNWNVFSNTSLWYEVVNFSDFDNTKIWNNVDTFSWWILLKDQYWNPVLPSPGINRKVTFNLQYSNDVYLNQYKKNWGSWIKWLFKDGWYSFLSIGTSNVFSNTYSSLSTSLYDGYYWLNFRSYVPTYDWYDKAYGRMNLISVEYNVKWDLLDVSNIFNINKHLGFKPQIESNISWIPPLAAEWTYKDFNISFTKNSSNYSDITFMVQFDPKWSDLNTYLAYNSTTDWWKYAIYGNSWTSLVSNLYAFASNKIWSFSDIDNINGTFYEKAVLQSGWVLDPSNQWVISTHFAVKYSDWTIAVWNSDLVGANNYNYNSTLENYLVQSAIWVQGLIWVSGKSKFKIASILSWKIDLWVGQVYKPALRAQVHKLVSQLTYWNETQVWINSNSYNIWDSSPSFEYKGVKIYYLKGDGNKLIIPFNYSLSDKVLLITKWIDIFLSWDIHTIWDGIFWIISLNDVEYPGFGNIYINNKVTNLDAYIYTDKAVITYKGDPLGTYITQDQMSQDDLKNQLLIKWVLLSFNTMGASSQWNCPYFDKTCSNPKKYDIDYLRRFYMLKANIIDPNSGSNYYVPYGITNTGDNNDTILVWWIKCDFVDCNGDGKKEAKCYDTNTDLLNIINVSSVWTCNPFSGLQTNYYLKLKLSPLIIQYDWKFKNEYLPVFSDLSR